MFAVDANGGRSGDAERFGKPGVGPEPGNTDERSDSVLLDDVDQAGAPLSDEAIPAVEAVDGAPQASAPDDDTSASEVTEEFVRLFTKYQRRIFLFILAQVGNPTEAEDLHQQTNLVLWTKFSHFKPGTNFLAWAMKIARYEILRRRARLKSERTLFSEEFLNAVAEEIEDSVDYLEARRAALAECLKKLRPRDRELIEQRYAPGATGKAVAERLGRPLNAVYQSLGRIRRALHECISRRLSAEYDRG
ncbi:MAG: sigma-70 family RNA polymerase sigma factor [Planctomycetota bacterium]|nr:MAG: sigma-70 family RNA polymerase sigma factor [Planctomycetota bacterium]